MDIVIVEIAGYNFHLSFFLLLFAIIFTIVLILLLKSRVDTKQEVLQGIKVTDWQKGRLYSILEKEKNDFIDKTGRINEETGEVFLYIKLLEQFQNYLQTQLVWDFDKFAAIDPNMILVFTTVLVTKSKEAFIEGDKNTALLLAHVVDLMNGSAYIRKETPDWIGDDIEESMRTEGMNVNEARLLKISETAIYDFAEYMYFSIDRRNPDVPDYLDHIILDDLDDALTDVLECKTYLDLKKKTYEVLAFAFYRKMEVLLKGLNSNTLRDFQLYPIRGLCCALDEELYDYILETIA